MNQIEMNSNALKYILQYIRKSTNSTDAMALVRFIRVYGNSDFFITFNVDCREAKAEIEPGQKPYDRPDILCRVFNQKNEFLKDIKRKVLGKIKDHVSVIEIQKRGIPHAHTLVWLED